MPLYRLSQDDLHFPNAELALDEPNGLLAMGGDLAPARLLQAYRQGIFPWFSPEDPVLWWSPDPRTVLFPDKVHISHSMRKLLKKNPFEMCVNRDFKATLEACAAPRTDQQGTWITPEMQQAYLRLHGMGYAHSIETWQDGVLVGGLYGVRIGQVFFGESMFSHVDNASKVALIALCQGIDDWKLALIDCQFATEHLLRMGATPIARKTYLQLLKQYT